MGTEQGGGGSPPDAALQFDKVEHAAPGGAELRRCQRPIHDEYFEVGGNMICAACARSLAGGADSGAFLRALAFGAGAAVLGTIVWFGISMASPGNPPCHWSRSAWACSSGGLYAGARVAAAAGDIRRWRWR